MYNIYRSLRETHVKKLLRFYRFSRRLDLPRALSGAWAWKAPGGDIGGSIGRGIIARSRASLLHYRDLPLKNQPGKPQNPKILSQNRCKPGTRFYLHYRDLSVALPGPSRLSISGKSSQIS